MPPPKKAEKTKSSGQMWNRMGHIFWFPISQNLCLRQIYHFFCKPSRSHPSWISITGHSKSVDVANIKHGKLILQDTVSAPLVKSTSRSFPPSWLNPLQFLQKTVRESVCKTSRSTFETSLSLKCVCVWQMKNRSRLRFLKDWRSITLFVSYKLRAS